MIVPIYNEARTIVQLVRQLNDLFLCTPFHCIFVDDGSTDDSLPLLHSALQFVTFSYDVVSQPNTGKAGAIIAATRLLDTSHVVILDSDLELDVNAIHTAWQVVLQEKYEAVLGFREFRSHSSFTYRYSRGNQLISNAFGILFNSMVSDVMCGFKMVPSEILRSLPLSFSGFVIEVEIVSVLWMKGVKPFELKIEYTPRTRAQGKSINTLDAIKVLISMLWLRIRVKRPKLSLE